MRVTKAQKEQAIQDLKDYIKPGMQVFTILRHVSKSGMSRVISVVVFKDNEPYWLSYKTAQALGWGWDDKHEGVKVQGCGMDMGDHLVYTLGYALFGEGYKLLQRWL